MRFAHATSVVSGTKSFVGKTLREPSVAFEISERLRQHTLRNIRNRAAESAEAVGFRREFHDTEHRPFVADVIEPISDGPKLRVEHSVGAARNAAPERLLPQRCP